MKILLTNDDSIYSEGIYALYTEVKKLGAVIVAAPDVERSSVGHGITLSHPILCKKVNRRGSFFGYGISGTPADCVKFAVKVLLKKKPDVIISGINLGSNDGCSVFYSGTVAAAREGALMGVPSLAVSLATFVNPDFRTAALFSRYIAGHVLQHGLPKGTFLNVNVPNKTEKNIKGVQVCRQGTTPIEGQFKKRMDPNLRTYYWMSGKAPRLRNQIDVDTYALGKGHITVSPVHCDLTDYRFMEPLQSWNLHGFLDNKISLGKKKK